MHMMNMQTKEFAQTYLPPYEHPPAWIPPHERDHHPDYCSDLERFLPRNISLQRSKTSEQLGFNIRGGREHNCGIYISKVMPNSEADRLGLQEGDQILSVNDQNFEFIDHSEAVKILKMNTSIWMVVRYFPYGQNIDARPLDSHVYSNLEARDIIRPTTKATALLHQTVPKPSDSAGY